MNEFWQKRWDHCKSTGDNYASGIKTLGDIYLKEIADVKKRILEFLEVKDNHYKSVLDFGCGTGSYNNLFKARYLGVDIIKEMIEQNRKKYKKKSFKCIKNKFKTHNRFDLIYCITVLQHLDDILLFYYLKLFKKICKELLIIEVSNESNNFIYHRPNLDETLIKLGYKLIKKDFSNGRFMLFRTR